MAENARLKKFKQAIHVLKRVIADKCDFSDDLVWYGRSGLHVTNNDPVAARARRRIERKYPAKVQEYKESPDWTHGYNSACLALSRLMLDVVDADEQVTAMNEQDKERGEEGEPWTVEVYIEQAIEEYPCLDT